MTEKETLTIKWPWGMVCIESVDEIVTWIKDTLPPDHNLQKHELFPGIKWERKPIFIVDDDTTGEYLLMDYENTKRWKKSKYRIPSITVLTSRDEVSSIIERDHQAEVAKHNTNGT